MDRKCIDEFFSLFEYLKRRSSKKDIRLSNCRHFVHGMSSSIFWISKKNYVLDRVVWHLILMVWQLWTKSKWKQYCQDDMLPAKLQNDSPDKIIWHTVFIDLSRLLHNMCRTGRVIQRWQGDFKRRILILKNDWNSLPPRIVTI